MKRLILFLLLIIPFLSFTQNSIGIRAGYNHSSMHLKGVGTINQTTTEYIAASNSIAGYYIGPSISLQVSDKYSLQYEIQYNSRGYNPEKAFGIQQIISIKEVNGGFLINRKLSEAIRVCLGYELSRRISRFNIDPFKWDHSAQAGFSLQLSERLSLETRYLFGLHSIHTNIIDINGGVTGMANASTRIVQFGLALNLLSQSTVNNQNLHQAN